MKQYIVRVRYMPAGGRQLVTKTFGPFYRQHTMKWWQTLFFAKAGVSKRTIPDFEIEELLAPTSRLK